LQSLQRISAEVGTNVKEIQVKILFLIAVCLLTIPVAAPRALAATWNDQTEVQVCGPPPEGFAHCNAIRVDGTTPKVLPAGYGPADLQSAYNLPSATGGNGQTVAIVDAYDDPNAASDLAIYRSRYGLPACSTRSGCFTKVNENGGTTSFPVKDGGWAEEVSLDLDMVSASCPRCRILLVEAYSASMTDLGMAVNTAVRLGANVISNSWGGDEFSHENSVDTKYFNHPGVVITASSGDSGYGVSYPASSKYVIGVGGTTLVRSSVGRGWAESVWGGSGSGCSIYEPKPSWQTDTGCKGRTVADVSADADPITGVAVYDSLAYQGYKGWLIFGGTSVSSPIIASTFALAGNARSIGQAGQYVYSHGGQLNKVLSGNNGSCSPSYLCTAGPGYNGPAGLGTPNGTGAF
jgi:subtilase family serine protease